MKTLVCLGEERHLKELATLSGKERTTRWTVPKTAMRGDRILFYLTRPVSAFVAEGRVAGDKLLNGAAYGWPNKLMTTVRVVRMAENPFTIRQAKADFPNWPWLRNPIPSTVVPATVEKPLLLALFSDSTLVDSTDDLQERGASEGELTERLVLHRSRELWKREEKLAASLALTGRLVCEVRGCDFDFFERYGELGRDFAHVHHRRPLSDTTTTRETLLKDLAIVCANCHAMIHRHGKCRELNTLIPRGKR